MTPKEFRARRIKVGLRTRPAAGRIFGASPDTIMGWEKGKSPIPRSAITILRLLERLAGFETFNNTIKELRKIAEQEDTPSRPGVKEKRALKTPYLPGLKPDDLKRAAKKWEDSWLRDRKLRTLDEEVKKRILTWKYIAARNKVLMKEKEGKTIH